MTKAESDRSRTFVIGVAGGSGSGKSTVVRLILESPLAEHICLLPHDAYYLNASEAPQGPDGEPNWDHPKALDNRLFVEHLEWLKRGNSVERPVHDFHTHTRTTHTVRLDPRPILLLEGILLLAIEEIRARIDLRVFIDTPADIRVVRRLARDQAERGRSVDSVLLQYQATVRPMHELLVEPSKGQAHLIIPWMNNNDPAVDALLSRIEAVARLSP